MRMNSQARNCRNRLLAGAAMVGLTAVWSAIQPAHVWNSIGREQFMWIQFRETLLAGSLGVMVVVLLAPVCWRGLAWQKLLAFVLGLPSLLLVLVAAHALWRLG